MVVLFWLENKIIGLELRFYQPFALHTWSQNQKMDFSPPPYNMELPLT